MDKAQIKKALEAQQALETSIPGQTYTAWIWGEAAKELRLEPGKYTIKKYPYADREDLTATEIQSFYEQDD